MVFNKKSLWTICALIALSHPPAQAMEQSEQITTRSSSIKLQDLPIEVADEVLRHAFMSAKTETTNFRNIGITLSLVCKEWNMTIRENSKRWICKHFNIPPQHREDFWRLFKGKLIYKPNPNSDERRVDFFISSLPNPLEGEFDLSNCGDTGQYLSINMGYRKVQTPANANKVEIWFTSRFLVDKAMPQLAPNHHMRAISANWNAARAPIGIFWTWGGWNASDHLACCNYLTAESMELLCSENLLKKYERSLAQGRVGCWGRGGTAFFTFRL